MGLKISSKQTDGVTVVYCNGRIVFGERLGGLACDDGARATTVEHEPSDKRRAEQACFAEQCQHLGRRPSVEGRRLNRDEDEIGGKQGRSHQPGDAGRPIDHHMIGTARQFGRFAVQGVARQPDDGEAAGQAFTGAGFGPVERGTLRIGVDEHDTLVAAGPFAGEMERERRLADAAFLVEQRDDHDRALRRPWGGFPPSPRSNKKLESLLDSKLRHGIAVSGQRVSCDPRARSPDTAAPEIPIPFAPEVPIASTTPSTGPVDKLMGRMCRRS